MRKKIQLLLLVLLFALGFKAQAQTLVAGDIVVIGFGTGTGPSSSTTLDEFSWVPLVNLNTGTIIYFTDAGWNTASNEFMGLASTTEILLKYTVPSPGVNAGVVQTVSEGGMSAAYQAIAGTKCGSDTNNLLTLNNTGDQITIFTSTATPDANFPAPGTFTPIFSFTSATNSWTALVVPTGSMSPASNKNNQSNLVTGLTNGTNAIAVGLGPAARAETDDARYNATVTSGSKAVILAAVTNISNWLQYDGTSPTVTSGADFSSLAGSSPVLGWTANGVTNYSVSGSDITPPVVQSISLVGSPAANSTSVTYTITFDESVVNVDTGDFNVTTVSGNATGSVASVSSSSGISMTVTVNVTSGLAGSIRLNLSGSTNIKDATGNGGGTNGSVAAYNSGSVHTVDLIAPTLTITSSALNPTNLNPIPVTFTFSESVTGFDSSDVVVTGGSIGSVSGSGASYTANVTPSADGTITVNVAAAKASDTAGNGNTAATQLSRTSDRTAPTIVSMNASVGNPTNANSFTLTITFSESVSGFLQSEIIMGNASLSSFSGGTGSVYTVTVTPTADGAVTANIGAGVANDAAGNGNSAATQFSTVSDKTSPSVSITSPGTPNPTNAGSINLTITFSESVSTFIQSELIVSGASITSFAGSGANYIATIAPSGSGTITANIAAGVATDTAGNNNSAAPQFSIVSDTNQPSVSISAASTPNPTNSASIPVTVTFSESVTGFVSGDVSLGNCSINTFNGSGTTYTFNVVPTSNGTITVNVNAGVASDSAGNTNTAATQLSRTYDNVAPGFGIPGPSGFTNLSPTNVGITLTESSTNFVSGDVSVTNGSVTGFSGSGTSYTVTVTPAGNGTVTTNVAAGTFTDAAGNANTATFSYSYTYDTVVPTVSINSVTSNPTNTASIPVTVTFSESVANFVQGDITLGNCSINSFSGSGTTYTFNVVPLSNGTVTVDIAGSVATDNAGNNNTAATQFSRVYDSVQPTVSITSGAPNPTNSSPIAVTVTFSESVANFIAGDVTVGNGTLNSFSGSGTTYTFNVVPSANGTVTVDVAAGVANDTAGNTNTAATQLSRVYDNTVPTVVITSPGTANPTNVNSFSITVTFSESVSNFVSGDITVGNGALSNFSGSGTTYTATVTPTADGTVTVNVAAGVANDGAGNNNTAATQYSTVSDKTGPTVNITSSATNPTNLNAIPVTFTFSESVADFISSDVFVSGGTLSGFTGSGTTYTGSIAPSGDGTINVFVFGGVATDGSGNGNSIGTFSIVSDRTRPTVVISSPQSSPTSTSPIVININFSEPVINFVQSDITVSAGASLSGFSGSGSSYTVNLTPTTNGNKNVNIAANTSTDLAGNLNFAAAQFSISYASPCSVVHTWTGAFWTNGSPTADQPAVIAADYDTSMDPGGFSACSLLVGSGFHAVVNPGDNLLISGNITVQSGATLTFENNSNLIQNGVATTGNSGNITIKRNATMIRQDYVYWSTPVAGQNLLAFSPATLTTRFYGISETTNAFVYINPATNSFQPAKGYAIRAPDNYVPFVPTAFEGIFTGVPQKGNISIPITHDNQGFNLIGNPYPSTISADAFLAANPSISSVYYWSHAQQSAPSGANYATYNATGAAAASNTVPTSAVPNGTIQVGQGFMVQTNAAGSAVFSNGMRVFNNDDQFYRTATDEKSRLWLNLASSEGTINQMLLGYVADATNAFDYHFDGKLVETQGTKLYNVINDAEYVIQGRALPFSDADVVPLGFKTDIDGTYTISLDHVDGIFSNEQDIFIKDNLTGIIHNIKLSDYSFAATAGTYHNRFEIVYQNNPLGTETPVLESSQIVLYKEQGAIRINSGAITMDNVKVFDIRGRMIYEKKNINAAETTLNDLNAGQEVLLVQITSTDGRMVTKKAVN